MATIELTAGTIEYQDTGGSGPVVALLGGLAMNGSLWRHVVSELSPDHRCAIPTLPLGGHRQPMRADADLSPRGIARLEAEILEALDLSPEGHACAGTWAEGQAVCSRRGWPRWGGSA